MRDAVERIEAFFTALTPADVARMGAFYTADVTFKDPFNEVRGLPEVQRIFTHMYEALDNPRFVITGRVVDGAQCFLVWEFRFAFRNFHKGVEQVVRGGSHMQLAPDGRIASHRDYWDAAEELYEKLPLVGGLMRWLKRRANG
ncbi:MAG: nuclear transport factor 2 family protein [Ramlibacter sp.]